MSALSLHRATERFSHDMPTASTGAPLHWVERLSARVPGITKQRRVQVGLAGGDDGACDAIPCGASL